ncbi:MAG: nicotinate-nucleotide--dimethylbenzimidazole phosphoribosyltransferase [Clostridia bacterium]
MHTVDLDHASMAEAKRRLDGLSKPLGSLGWLEDAVVQVCGILGTPDPDITKKAVAVFCADNGVVEEGVSQVGSEVTAAVARNFTRGITAINVFTRRFHQDLFILDVGIKEKTDHPGILDRNIMRGTFNMTKMPAMTMEQAGKAVDTGIQTVGMLKEMGYGMVGTGEMGIGNTTTSSAITKVLLSCCTEDVTGRGAGLSDEGLARKIRAIDLAIETNRPDPSNPLDVLSKVGGLDIACICGCFLGGMIHRIPVVMDGFISAAGALLAYRMNPCVKKFMIVSHGSAEPGSKYIFREMGLSPVLDMGLRLGEGTGASMIMSLLDLAFDAYHNMGTFEQASIRKYEHLNGEQP